MTINSGSSWPEPRKNNAVGIFMVLDSILVSRAKSFLDLLKRHDATFQARNEVRPLPTVSSMTIDV